MILRPAVAADAATFENFDLGDASASHLAEVAEIVRDLWPWSHDPSAVELDRQVHVAEQDGVIVGVVAHHLVIGESGRAIAGHRYLMVTAIQLPYQRGGYATAILAALFAEMRAAAIDSVEWLVHPSNHASIQFSNRAFPMADETSPPEDKPYVRYLLRLKRWSVDRTPSTATCDLTTPSVRGRFPPHHSAPARTSSASSSNHETMNWGPWSTNLPSVSQLPAPLSPRNRAPVCLRVYRDQGLQSG